VTTNDLFAIDAKVIFLPYKKDIDGPNPSFIQKKIIQADFPVFADKFLIYHPNYEILNHIGISKIEKIPTRDMMIIHPQNDETMLKALLNNKGLRDFYISYKPTYTTAHYTT
jgi:hypothetical protein